MPEPRGRISIGELLQETDGSIKTGPFGTVLKSHEYSDQGAPVISVREVGYGEFRIEESTPRAPPEVQERLPEYLLEPGDIVFGRKGAVDRAAAVEPRHGQLFLGSDGIRLRPPSSVSATYLAYAVRTPECKTWLAQHATGSTMPSLSQGIIERLPVRIPVSRAEQEAVVSILKPLDDRIALNHAMNQTLEDIARAIFKSWFIDHDPVHAKAERRSTGLPSEIDALFPSSLVETEEGMVPEGWSSVPLREQVEVTRGLSYSGAGLGEPGEGVPMHNLNSIYEGGGYKTAGLKWFTGEFKERHIANAGDVLVANTEQGFDRLLIGYPALVPDAWDGPTIFSHHLYKVEPKPNARVTRDFLAYWLKDRTIHDRVSGFANGTTVNMLPKDALEMPEIVPPPRELVEAFGRMIRAFHEKMELNEKQATTLGNLRDLLLPKLISDELQIPMQVSA